MSLDDGQHIHSDAWPTEWLAMQAANITAEKDKAQILRFIEERGTAGFTANMYCQIISATDDLRINTVRRRFYDLRDEGKIRYHPDGLTIKNANGKLVKAWIPGKDPNAGNSRLQRAIAEADQLRLENSQLKSEIARLRRTDRGSSQLGLFPP